MDRTEFAKRLNTIIVPEGISEKERQELVLPISDAIVQMMPQSLFRYRPCDESMPEKLEQQIDSFEKDTIYAVSADKFNDPYDTLVRYDLNAIKEYISSLLTCDTISQMKVFLEQGNDFPELVKKSYPVEFVENAKKHLLAFDPEAMGKSLEEYKKQMIQSIDFWYPILAHVNKMFVTIACFCESVQSIAMWSHYAHFHQGFALEYNFRPTLIKGIENCGIYPVIYDDERFDASSYMATTFIRFMGNNIPNPDILSHIKCSLHKATLWDYEKEWRLLDYSPRNNIFTVPYTTIQYKPVAIYYGVNMALALKERLHNIAQRKKIAEYEMYMDYSSPKYEMQYKPYEFSK